MFKAGDKVRCINGHRTGIGGWPVQGESYTVKGCHGSDQVMLHELPDWWSISRFTPVEGSDPIRTVTKKELVLGSYGRVKVCSEGLDGPDSLGLDITPRGANPSVCMNYILNAKELREAAALFTQLAEYLEDKTRQGCRLDLINAPEPDKDLGWRNLYNNHDFLGNRWESKELAEISGRGGHCGESREGSYLSTHHLVLRSGKIVDVTDESS